MKIRTLPTFSTLFLSTQLSFGQLIEVQKIEVQDSRVTINHSSNPDSYYLLQRLNLESQTEGPFLDIANGESETSTLTDHGSPWDKRFYRIHEFSQENPDDIDGDGMDDLYEWNEPTLNPFDPSDSGDPYSLGDTTTTQLDTYKNNYLIGMGRADVTGVSVAGGMMGYSDPFQRSKGIHDRQWARAFIVKDRRPPGRSVVHVVVDTGQVFQSVYQGVINKIKADDLLKNHYCHENIVLSATHTHGGAGGHSHFALYHALIVGYDWRTYDAIVHGIYLAIKRAHQNLAPGGITRNRGNISDANENRRPIAFLQNVEHQFPDKLGNPFGNDNRDTEMTLLRFDRKDDDEEMPSGMLNWFPVHGVSVSKLNELLTGDNKGYAAFQIEKNNGAIYPGFDGYRPRNPSFVGAFANSNPGDMTANRRESESPWKDPTDSDYNGTFSMVDDYNRALLIGGRQYQKAQALLHGEEGQLAKVTGTIDYRHMYVDMNSVSVNPPEIYPYNIPGVGFQGLDSSFWKTCRGALGAEMTAGTSDGEGMDLSLLQSLGQALSDPCQTPKDIILTTASSGPGGLTPHWVPLSILRIGDVVILAVPSELTVMAGYRLRKTVENAFAAEGQRVRAIVSGLSNSYSGYVTTYEEYVHEEPNEGLLKQGYEAASTHFGAFTLAAYQTKFAEMARNMARNESPPVGEILDVKIPTEARSEPIIPTPSDWLAVLDIAPLPTLVEANYHGENGCGPGEFPILGTTDCWSCPDDYSKALIVTTKADACEIPEGASVDRATQHGDPGCPPGQFWIFGTSNCFKCPPGTERELIVLSKTDACFKAASTEYKLALVEDVKTPCPLGYIPDYGLGACYACPPGYTKGLVPWNASNACFKGFSTMAALVEPLTPECSPGYIKNDPDLIGALPERCYKCPDGFTKGLLTWDDPLACVKITLKTNHDAESQGPGGLICPPGQFFNFATGKCWSCPLGFDVDNGKPIDGPSACFSLRKTTEAIPEGKEACELRSPNWFTNFPTGECWSCPTGTNRRFIALNRGEGCEIPRDFGQVRIEPELTYNRGQSVEVSFWAGHPKNAFGVYEITDLGDPETGGATQPAGVSNFFTVQYRNEDRWETVRTDADWDTFFEWTPQGLSGAATFTWKIPNTAKSGDTFRIRHQGKHSVDGGVSPYSGYSREFTIN